MKTLSYYTVDGALGWNQDWFRDWWMHVGGCGAVTACDLALLMARRPELAPLYPGDPAHVTRQAYEAFAMQMKPYLRPRWGGIDTLDLYLEGFGAYLRGVGASQVRLEGLAGEAPWQEGAALVRRQIDAGIPVPCLTLHHKDKRFNFFEWHWYNLAGYDLRDGVFHVRAVTYGQEFWLDFPALWRTGHKKRGGLIALHAD